MTIKNIYDDLNTNYSDKILPLTDDLLSTYGIISFLSDDLSVSSFPTQTLTIANASWTLSDDETELTISGSLQLFEDLILTNVDLLIAQESDGKSITMIAKREYESDEKGVPSLAGLVEWVGGDDLEDLLPDELKEDSTLYLKEYSFNINCVGISPYITISLTISSSNTWSLIPDVLEITDMDFSWTIRDPFLSPEDIDEEYDLDDDVQIGRRISFQIFASVEIADAPFDVEAEFPRDIVSIDLDTTAYPGINLLSIADHFGLALENIGIDSLICDSLSVSVNTESLSYSIQATIDGSWTLVSGVDVTSIQMDLRSDNSIIREDTQVEVALNAFLTLVSTDFSIVADNSTSDGGWTFSGGTYGDTDGLLISDFISGLISDMGLGEVPVPPPIADLEIEDLSISYNTSTQDLSFEMEVEFPLDGQNVDAVIKLDLSRNEEEYSVEFSGVITVNDLEFDLIFKEDDSSTIFLAAYENSSGKDESIESLLELITTNSDFSDFASGVSFNLQDALLVVDKGESTRVLFGMDIGGGVDLSNLPLVGKMLPSDSSVSMTFQPLVANNDFSSEDMDGIKDLVPDGGYELPDEASEGLGFHMQLKIGDKSYDFNVGIGADDVKDQPASDESSPASSEDDSDTSSDPPATSDSSGGSDVKWYSVKKKLGPISLGRVGVQFQAADEEAGTSAKLYFLLDASLELAGLSISLDGLYASSGINPIHPSFGLHGLGIDYASGPVEIGGAFLRQTATDSAGNSYDTYDGTALIKTDSFSLGAIGSYSYYQGHPSLFIYAFLDAPLGGPSFFFVKGLAAGFGYNRRLIMPALEDVSSFPLVAEAMAGEAGTTDDPGAELSILHDLIPPAVGEYFLAVGVKYSSFEIIDSFALLAVSFGQEFEVDVLGISTLVIPTPDENETEPLAEIQMALKAVFNPGKGYLKVESALTSDSFILSKDCHLTGGFAFYSWFKDSDDGASAGDFVLTLGGYHPKFDVPDYYPQVSPLGFNWQVTDELDVKGDMYFALVPSAVMAGGHISATWKSGNLKAWYQEGADFIISWKPYYYQASIYVDMGVSYTYHFFGTHHLTVDVGANLDIWGPEFSGKAHIHLSVVTFDVKFGGNKSEPEALTWNEFCSAFLPSDADKWISTSVQDGMISKANAIINSETTEVNIVNPKYFNMEIHSAVPTTVVSNVDASVGSTKVYIGSMKINDDTFTDSSTGETVDLGDYLNLKMDISILKISEAGSPDKTDKFSFSPILKAVPGALWGPKFTHSEDETSEERMIQDICMGFSFEGAPSEASDESHRVDSQNLLTEQETFDKTATITDAEVILNTVWLKQEASDSLYQQLESQQSTREDFLNSLGFQEQFFPSEELFDELILTHS